MANSIRVVALTLLCCVTASVDAMVGGTSAKTEDPYPAWRAAAAQTLAARGTADALATAAALTFLGPPARSRVESGKAATAALALADRAIELAPSNAAIGWLRLQLCAAAPECDIREAATTLRWVDADNGAAWLPLLVLAQRDKDGVEVDRILADMAQGARFDVYANRTTVLMFDALRAARSALPAHYLTSDLGRLTEASGLADAAVIPAFSPVINACREAAAERRERCLELSKTLQHADTILAQLVGFSIARRLTAPDSKELRVLAERRHLLEWRAAAADQSDATQLPWVKTARARSRLAIMRKFARQEDADIALLRERKMPLEAP
jgi:hypothetical protein